MHLNQWKEGCCLPLTILGTPTHSSVTPPQVVNLSHSLQDSYKLDYCRTSIFCTHYWISNVKMLLVIQCSPYPIQGLTSQDSLEHHIHEVDDDEALLPLSVGVSLVAQLEVRLSEAVGQWRPVDPLVEQPSLEHQLTLLVWNRYCKINIEYFYWRKFGFI